MGAKLAEKEAVKVFLLTPEGKDWCGYCEMWYGIQAGCA